MERCDAYLVVEHNADVYPCDFFVQPEWKLGNLVADRLEAVLNNPLRRRFAALKTARPPGCRECRFGELCQGDCPRFRAGPAAGPGGGSRLCQAWTRLFEHLENHPVDILERAAEARRLHQARQAAPPGRNSPCPCGSGRKYKHCCLPRIIPE